MASARYTVPLEARARAQTVLEREGPTAVFAAWRADGCISDIRWLAGGTLTVLRDALDRTVRDLTASRDPAAGLAAVHLLQALVLALLDGEPAASGDRGGWT